MRSLLFAAAIVATHSPAVKPKVIAPALKPTTVPPTPMPILDQPCIGDRQHDRRSALCAQWVAADAATNSANYTLVYTIFTAASIAGLIATLVLTLRSIRIARETAQRQLRAYVSVTPTTLALYHGDKVMRVGIKLKNGGTTPAYDCIHAGNIVILSPEQARLQLTRNDNREKLGERASFALHAGQEMDGSITGTVKFTEQQLAEVKSGSLALYAFGFAEYRDTFGDWRRSHFCFSVSGLEFRNHKTAIEKEGELLPMAWALEPFHNEAD